ncbi:hypothetical protein ElyMa_005065900 [Elysia marginata]|uniref:Uncharacterized protein n=1 Tax=Elysia marginata TaxID=1093978 RepID=A0AAV4JEM9_9GAST|nr:hypothetical protein ElyMa_005065900 [Elysia marginata]
MKDDIARKEQNIQTLEKEKDQLSIELLAKNEVINQQKEKIDEQAANEYKIKNLTTKLKQADKNSSVLEEELENVQKTKLYKKNEALKKYIANLTNEKEEMEKALEVQSNKIDEINQSLSASKAGT